MRSIGGKTLNQLVYNVWENILTDNVAKDLNWLGIQKKNSRKTGFSNKKLTQAVFGEYSLWYSLVLNYIKFSIKLMFFYCYTERIRATKPIFKDVSMDDFKDSTNNFLRHAPARYKTQLVRRNNN